MKKIKVLIPAGGSGTRFNNSEFVNLKPFIYIHGKTMFEWIIIGFKSKKYEVSYDIIIRLEFKEQYDKEIKHLEKTYNVKFHFINLTTEGTTATALFLYDELNNNDSLMIANCDQIIDIDFDDYLEKHFEEKETDGSVLVFDKETENKWSFVEVNEKMIVKRIVAKEAISDLAISGWYFWTKSSDFIKYGVSQIINLDKVNGEYYLCPVFNYAIKENKVIKAIQINKSQMHGVGTPEDLKKYLELKQL